jgi:hypothetical protein
MVDVPAGAIWRYTHAVGASVFFICVYVHLIRGVYYGSFAQPREAVSTPRAEGDGMGKSAQASPPSGGPSWATCCLLWGA